MLFELAPLLLRRPAPAQDGSPDAVVKRAANAEMLVSVAEQSRGIDLVRGDLEDYPALRADRRGVVLPGVLA